MYSEVVYTVQLFTQFTYMSNDFESGYYKIDSQNWYTN
jgi:hypothetical protein